MAGKKSSKKQDDQIKRFASGEIKGVNFTRKNKGGGFGFVFEGYFEDTKEQIEETYYGSKFPIPVFEEGKKEPLDPEEAQDLRFAGRVMLVIKEYDGEEFIFPQAVVIVKRIEQLEPGYEEITENPFLDPVDPAGDDDDDDDDDWD